MGKSMHCCVTMNSFISFQKRPIILNLTAKVNPQFSQFNSPFKNKSTNLKNLFCFIWLSLSFIEQTKLTFKVIIRRLTSQTP
jgi:hypothetical protein